MVTGTVVLVVWKQIGLSSYLYEIVPGFVANCVTIVVVNMIIPQRDDKILTDYNQVIEKITSQIPAPHGQLRRS